MSFQAYLDNIELKTGKTPQEFIELAAKKGFGSDTKAGEIVSWLKEDFGLGHGHAMALVHVIKKVQILVKSMLVLAGRIRMNRILFGWMV